MRRQKTDNTFAILALLGLVAIVAIVALTMRRSSQSLPTNENWELSYTPDGNVKGLTVRQLPSLQEVARALTRRA